MALLRRWGLAAKVAGVPVDPSVLQAGQPIYTARPQFRGMGDPVPQEHWAFVLPGVFGDRVSLVADRYDKGAEDIVRRVREAAANCGDWRELLEQTLGGPEGFHEPLKRGIGLAAQSTATEQEIVDFVTALLAERADPGRMVSYGPRWVCKVVQSFRIRDQRTETEISNLKERLLRKQ